MFIRDLDEQPEVFNARVEAEIRALEVKVAEAEAVEKPAIQAASEARAALTAALRQAANQGIRLYCDLRIRSREMNGTERKEFRNDIRRHLESGKLTDEVFGDMAFLYSSLLDDQSESRLKKYENRMGWAEITAQVRS